MKLTVTKPRPLSKEVRVKGGRVVKVNTVYDVKTDHGHLTVHQNDLAVEVLGIKSDTFHGYSYLTGDARGLVRVASQGNFDFNTRVALIPIDEWCKTSAELGNGTLDWDDLRGELNEWREKYDLLAFAHEITVGEPALFQRYVMALLAMLQDWPEEIKPEDRNCHVVGIVRGVGKRMLASLHVHPKSKPGEGASLFQIQLVLTGLGVDPGSRVLG